MKTKRFTISIPEPCSENWNEMSATEQGKFCAHCQKNVIDFSSKTDTEIANFVKNNKGIFCGRFAETQLEKEFIYTEQEKYSNLKYAAALAFGLLTVENTFAQNNKPKVEIVNKNQYPICLNAVDSIKNDSINEFEVVITAPKVTRQIQGGAILIETTNFLTLPKKMIEPVKLKKKR